MYLGWHSVSFLTKNDVTNEYTQNPYGYLEEDIIGVTYQVAEFQFRTNKADLIRIFTKKDPRKPVIEFKRDDFLKITREEFLAKIAALK